MSKYINVIANYIFGLILVMVPILLAIASTHYTGMTNFLFLFFAYLGQSTLIHLAKRDARST